MRNIITGHRAASALLIYNTENLNIDNIKNQDLDDMMNELLNKDLICLILDCLEEYGQFSLSLLMCNRFTLPVQSAKFTVSLLTKHSNISNTDARVNIASLYDKRFNKVTDENRFLAAKDFFDVLQNVDNVLLNRVDLPIKTNTLESSDISKFVALGFWRQCPIILPLDETKKLFAVFNAFDVCVVVWCNCLEDLQKRNNILTKFNNMKKRSEKINYIMNHEDVADSKHLKQVSFAAFAYEILWSADLNTYNIIDMPLFSNILKGLIEIDAEDFDIRDFDTSKISSIWNLVYEKSYSLMSGFEKSKLNLNMYDLGASLALCFSLFSKKAAINFYNENEEKATLLSPHIKQVITKIHKNTAILLNISKCIKVIGNIFCSIKNHKKIRKFMKGFLKVYLAKKPKVSAECLKFYNSSNLIVHRSSILLSASRKCDEKIRFWVDNGFEHSLIDFNTCMAVIQNMVLAQLKKEYFKIEAFRLSNCEISDCLNIYNSISIINYVNFKGKITAVNLIKKQDLENQKKVHEKYLEHLYQDTSKSAFLNIKNTKNEISKLDKKIIDCDPTQKKYTKLLD